MQADTNRYLNEMQTSVSSPSNSLWKAAHRLYFITFDIWEIYAQTVVNQQSRQLKSRPISTLLDTTCPLQIYNSVRSIIHVTVVCFVIIMKS
jgi:hypothetical protein